MMRALSKFALPLFLAGCLLLLTGCYQAKMTTNKEPGDTVVEKSFASSFIYGLVPAEVDVSDECTNGIASATRKISFLNGLVGSLTLNIYTPQSVTVTCAADGSTFNATTQGQESSFTVSEDADTAEIKETLSTAALQSTLAKEPVEVQIAVD
jgi:hypothetical protein